MRVGLNPNKDKILEPSKFTHQIVIPVYIPNLEDYFKDSFKILKLCISSLLETVHNKTFISIVNNGSCREIKKYLDNLIEAEIIHELIHTENIGKLNAIIKGLVGSDIALVTISDSDVLFLPDWQFETLKVFENVPKAGVVGIVPQFKMYESNCGNVIFDNFFSKKLKFLLVKNSKDLKRFYDSIGWDKKYNQDYLKYSLGLEVSQDLRVLIGSGHFVATYKKDIFDEITSFIGYKLGGVSETYLDKAPLKKGYWRVTTEGNYAYHMGNALEDWMEVLTRKDKSEEKFNSSFRTNKKTNKFVYFFKNRVFVKFISIAFLNGLFLKWKGLPKDMVNRY